MENKDMSPKEKIWFMILFLILSTFLIFLIVFLWIPPEITSTPQETNQQNAIHSKPNSPSSPTPNNARPATGQLNTPASTPSVENKPGTPQPANPPPNPTPEASKTAETENNSAKPTEASKETAKFKKDDDPVKILSWNSYYGTYLILMVAIVGALGACIHAMVSFVFHAGEASEAGGVNEDSEKGLKESFRYWYYLRPITGSSLAVIFYFVIRGGLIPIIVQNADKTAASINIYGTLALAGIIGMASKEAIAMLKDLFDIIFRRPKEEENKEGKKTQEEAKKKQEEEAEKARKEKEEKEKAGGTGEGVAG